VPLSTETNGTAASEVLAGGAGNDLITGGNGTDTINGGTGNDTLNGGTGPSDLRDVIFGGDGNDVIDGGAGSDFALFDGARSEYQIFRTSSNEVRTSGADGFDIHTDVEYFRFDDGDVTIWELAIV